MGLTTEKPELIGLDAIIDKMAMPKHEMDEIAKMLEQLHVCMKSLLEELAAIHEEYKRLLR